MEKENELKQLKNTIKAFVEKYDIKDIIIDIEDYEPEVCSVYDENKLFKKVTITLEY